MGRNYYREDGRIWFDDQICDLADLLMGTEGIRHVYRRKPGRKWIRGIGDDGMRSAVKGMSEVQIRIIELLIFEDRTAEDVRRTLGLTTARLRAEMRNMRKALLSAM